MYRIVASHANQGTDVVGNEFGTLQEAHDFLKDNGWDIDPLGSGEWCKNGPTRMCGLIGVSIVEYVQVEKV